jgi:transcription termination factor NusB
VYELLYDDVIPPKVTINEALDISKKIQHAQIHAFINGILDHIPPYLRKTKTTRKKRAGTETTRAST